MSKSRAVTRGVADEARLEKALHWAIIRHPMLRAAALEPSVRAKDTGEGCREDGPKISWTRQLYICE